MEFIYTREHWTRESVAADTERNYIFGDNLLGVGNGGQACIRGLPNAFGVPTKVSPDMGTDAFFYDALYDANKARIDAAIAAIPTDKPVVYNVEIGRGLAELHIRAPRTYDYLASVLNFPLMEFPT